MEEGGEKGYWLEHPSGSATIPISKRKVRPREARKLTSAMEQVSGRVGIFIGMILDLPMAQVSLH